MSKNNTLDDGTILCQFNRTTRMGYLKGDNLNYVVEKYRKIRGKDGTADRMGWVSVGWFTFNAAIRRGLEELTKEHLMSFDVRDRNLEALYEALDKARRRVARLIGKKVKL